MRTCAAILGIVASTLTVADAAPSPAGHCTHETFPVGGQSVAVTICAASPDGATVPITETYKGSSGSFNHTAAIEVLAGASASRTMDDVALAPLGLQYTLHLTLAYRNGVAAIEHALLLPGAVPLK